ncbi:MAG: type III pantothenate kinase [Spirochaetaceae bacterium]|jgi:type III pantothenate kinase|nr:type III pantothenate kinase [Spirochaetaceae bacterium]
MLLVVDIGNTNIVAGLFRGDEITEIGRVYTDVHRTGDEYGIIFRSLLREIGMPPHEITRSALSSVVPALTGPFTGMIKKLTGRKPLLVNHTIYDMLPIKTPAARAREIGADLVCNAVAAFTRFKGACIVVDFGTALTFTCIGKDGRILGCAIAPGLGTAVNALSANAAQLSIVPLEAPPSSLGADTVQAIQSGIVLGYKGLVEFLLARMKTDMTDAEGGRTDDITVIATGGLNSVLQPITGAFRYIDKQLTLHGLKIISDTVLGLQGAADGTDDV